jgi:hypothetical protein
MLGLFGCESALDLADDPQVVVVETGPWRCLGKTSEPVVSSKPTASVHVRTCDFVSNCTTNIPDMTARLCSKRDVNCSTPLLSNIPDVNKNGDLHFEVPTGFDGYLEVTSPKKSCLDFGDQSSLLCPMANQLQGCDLANAATDPRCFMPTYAQTLLFFNPPIGADTTVPLDLPMLSLGNAPTLLQSAGIPIAALASNPSGGNLFVTVRDCDGKPASGVKLSIPAQDHEVFQMYIASGLPTRDATETDSSGVGAFVGIPAKFVEVSAFAPDGRLIGKIGVQGGPSSLTYSNLAPQ